jgi:signal transduction histidine kinase
VEQTVTILDLTNDEVIEQLKQHRLLKNLPVSEMEWLARHGKMRRYETGDYLVRTGTLFDDASIGLAIILAGSVSARVDRGLGPRKVVTWHAGDITGMTPFSRATRAAGDGVAEEPVVTFSIPPSHFPEMIRECPAVIEHCVHVMLDRTRAFVTSEWQDEKIVSLAKLASGLAHELNNPASAVARSAKLLTRSMADADRAAEAMCLAHLNEEQLASIRRVRTACQRASQNGLRSPLERADREDAIAHWLVAHGADTSALHALVETAVTIQDLDELARVIPGNALDAALDWVAAGSEVRMLAADIERAGARIYELVAAVKGFTHLDRAHLPEPIDLEHGLRDTLAVLASKVSARKAKVTIDVPPNTPRVSALPSELNQVWAHVIDNALDAVRPSGQIMVSARQLARYVVVRVIDDGAGIPDDVMHRIYDPFFTTKQPGQGAGLGLDIARRIVRSHNGDIEAESKPGRTEFRISLPIAEDIPAGASAVATPQMV